MHQTIVNSLIQVNQNLSIGVVVSEFNASITQALESGCLAYLKENHCESITLIKVPGAIEIPLIIKKLAKLNQFDALIALGAVIRGETSHYDYVCQQVSIGCQQVMLDQEIPVVFGLLTTENEQQAWERLGGNYGHKGEEAAKVALQMISVIKQIKQLQPN